MGIISQKAMLATQLKRMANFSNDLVPTQGELPATRGQASSQAAALNASKFRGDPRR
jgi:hypothetical protein